MSGIDHALWDIASKAPGLPIYMLLGSQFRDRVRVYHGVQGSSPEKLANHGLALLDED